MKGKEEKEENKEKGGTKGKEEDEEGREGHVYEPKPQITLVLLPPFLSKDPGGFEEEEVRGQQTDGRKGRTKSSDGKTENEAQGKKIILRRKYFLSMKHFQPVFFLKQRNSL